MDEELNREKVGKIFEESWKELIGEYSEARKASTFCSEYDVELRLAHKLLKKLPDENVHIEFPIPLEIELLMWELWGFGRVSTRKCIIPDIVVINPRVQELYLIAELKFKPIYWSYLPLYSALKGELSKEWLEVTKDTLKRDINNLKRMREEEPTQQYIEKEYLGGGKEPTSVEKMIKILNDFKNKEGETILGYLCVIGEFYPNIEQILQKAIQKYNPPDNFQILANYFEVSEFLKKVLEKISK